jgi:hypothetical protein
MLKLEHARFLIIREFPEIPGGNGRIGIHPPLLTKIAKRPKMADAPDGRKI